MWDTKLTTASIQERLSGLGSALGHSVEVKGSVIPNPFSRLGLCLSIFNLFAVLSCLGLKCQRALRNTASHCSAKPRISGSVSVIPRS